MDSIKAFFGGTLFDYQSSSGGILEISLEYLTNSSDYVDQMDSWRIMSLTMVARSYSEYLSFFKEVAKIMGNQCDMAASSCDLRIKLSPVFRVSYYFTENDLIQRVPWSHDFIRFRNKFYKDVHGFRCPDF